MKTLELKNATDSLAEYLSDPNRAPLMVTEDGAPVGLVLSVRNSDYEAAALSANPDFLALIEGSWGRWQTEGGISAEEMRRRYGATPH